MGTFERIFCFAFFSEFTAKKKLRVHCNTMEDEAAVAVVARLASKRLRLYRNLIRIIVLIFGTILIIRGICDIFSGRCRHSSRSILSGIIPICVAIILIAINFYLLYKNKLKDLVKFSAVVMLGGTVVFVIALASTLGNLLTVRYGSDYIKFVYGVLVMLSSSVYYFYVIRYRNAVMYEYRHQPVDFDEASSLSIKEEEDYQ